jgi:hypothetical protein
MTKCPIHDVPLTGSRTEFGNRWSCPRAGCTVVWWGRRDTTPADAHTRAARIRAHAAFDTLWKPGPERLMGRNRAYRWLQETLGMEAAEAHIGLFSLELCERVIEAVRQLRTEHALTSCD